MALAPEAPRGREQLRMVLLVSYCVELVLRLHGVKSRLEPFLKALRHLAVPNSFKNLRKPAQTPVAPLVKLTVKNKVLHGSLLPSEHQLVHRGTQNFGCHHLVLDARIEPFYPLLLDSVVHSAQVVLVQVIKLVKQLITLLKQALQEQGVILEHSRVCG